MSKVYCSRCLYDSGIPNIIFDSNGVCSLCKLSEKMEEEYPNDERGERILKDLAHKMKNAGRGKEYDCIVGVSGGCDSSFLLYKMVDLGLRPLAVHFDNTWNSRIATENIHRVTKKLDVDLFTIVVNNKEFDDIIRSFFYASVPDINITTDIALAATLYKAAEKFKVKYQIEGHSFRTEGVSPLGWTYMDARYIKSVLAEYGTYKIKTLPNLWMKDFLRWMLFLRIKKIRPLYYIDYQKEEVKKFLHDEFGWEWYGGHHLENKLSVFSHTYFFPRKVGIDQRANGFSALVRSNQMERDEAIRLLSSPPEYDQDTVDYFIKRMNITPEEFERVINLPMKTYRDFKTYKKYFELMRPFFWIMYKQGLVPKSFYVKYTAKNGLLNMHQRRNNGK
ncbi:MAG: N-acetyl sugar amidotransferase [Bacteroidetes bacterium]|nr:N-acetyl sugar amidotransferase [Bacteroidota bacterium]